MELTVETGAIPTIHVAGEIDHFVCGQLNQKIEELVDSGITTLLLDFSEVSYLDSAGVAAVIEAIQRLAIGAGGKVSLVVKHPDVYHILDLVGLTSHIEGFTLMDDREKAIQTLAST